MDKIQIRNSTADFLVFTRDAKAEGVEVRVQDSEVWLTQKAIGQLFEVDRSVVTKHLQRIYDITNLGIGKDTPYVTVDGKKLYELAREGKVIERKARPVKIHEIVIESMNLPEVVMSVSCSKGTYIRTLCNDIGAKLSVGGCMKELLRTKVGRFVLEETLTLSDLQKLKEEGRLEEALEMQGEGEERKISISSKALDGLSRIGRMRVMAEAVRRMERGQVRADTLEKMEAVWQHRRFPRRFSFAGGLKAAVAACGVRFGVAPGR